MSDSTNQNRTRCQIYSRVSGFITPVSNYNTGKKSEFYSRKYYSVDKSLNSQFIEEYGNCVNYNGYKSIIKTPELEEVSC